MQEITLPVHNEVEMQNLEDLDDDQAEIDDFEPLDEQPAEQTPTLDFDELDQEEAIQPEQSISIEEQ